MKIITTIHQFPHPLRIPVPIEQQQLFTGWLDAVEESEVMALLDCRQDQITSAHNDVVDAAEKCRTWLVPLLREHGFKVDEPYVAEDFFANESLSDVMFEHEVTWTQRNPSAIIYELADIDRELPSAEFDGTIGGLIEALKQFPPNWRVPGSVVGPIPGGEVRVSETLTDVFVASEEKYPEVTG